MVKMKYPRYAGSLRPYYVIPDELKPKFSAGKLCCVYKILNTWTGDYYLGSTENAKQRWSVHVTALRMNDHFCKNLQADWVDPEDEDKFLFIFIEEYFGENVKELEQVYLDTYNPPYNTSIDANSGLGGRKMPDELCEHYSKTRTGTQNHMYGRRGENSPIKGRSPSEEQRQRLSESLSKGNYFGICPKGEVYNFTNAVQFAKKIFNVEEGGGIIQSCKRDVMTYKEWIFMYEDEYNQLLQMNYMKMPGSSIGEVIALGRCFNAYKATSPEGNEYYYFSAREMSRQLGFCRQAVRKRLKGDKTEYKGWRFEYVEFEQAERLPNKKPRMVKGVSPEGEEYFFYNMTEFAKEFNLIPCGISSCCTGEFRSHYGWTFGYIG